MDENETVALRPLWRRMADGVLIAAFGALLVGALAGPLMALVRPGGAVFFGAEDIARYTAQARLDPAPFYWTRLVTSALAGLILAGAGALLFRQHRRQPVAALLACSFLVLSITIYGAQLYGVPELTFFLGRFASSAWSLFTIALLMFPDGRFWPGWSRWLALAVVVLTALAFAGWLPVPFAPVGVALLLVAVGILSLRYRRLPAGAERQQIRWALLGFALGAPLTILTVGLQFLGLESGRVGPAEWVWIVTVVFAVLLPLSHLLISGGLLISLLSYRLYDADQVISRSVSFGTLTVLLLGVFAAAEAVIELLSEEWFGESLGVLAGGLGAAFAALMIVPLHERLTSWAERRFQRDLLALRTGLPALVGDLRETAPAERIAAATLDWVVEGVRASRAALLVDGDTLDARGLAVEDIERWRTGWLPPPGPGLDVARADALFPVRLPLEADGHGRVGWLLLGPRPDGSLYGGDERAALAEIADPVARALEVAGLRKQREAAERSHWQSQQALNERLLATLDRLDARLDGMFTAPPAPKRNGRSRRQAKPAARPAS